MDLASNSQEERSVALNAPFSPKPSRETIGSLQLQKKKLCEAVLRSISLAKRKENLPGKREERAEENTADLKGENAEGEGRTGTLNVNLGEIYKSEVK